METICEKNLASFYGVRLFWLVGPVKVSEVKVMYVTQVSYR